MSLTYPKINDPKIVSIPVKENGEALVNFLDLDRLFLLSQTKISSENIHGDSEHPVVRVKVKEKLRNVIKNLPSQYGLFMDESYRSYEYQKSLFQNQVAKLMSEKEIDRVAAETEASRFVSNPDVYSPHVTGGAIDLAIISLDTKELLDIGNNFTYDDSAKTDYSGLTQIQKNNRRLLIDIMTQAGFVNYPYEWWHWSYGDKYWAHVTGKPYAIYGSISHFKVQP